MLAFPGPRPELVEAKSSAEDWTGLRSRAERRKLQTRLNVRAHRRRKAEAAKRSANASSDEPHKDSHHHHHHSNSNNTSTALDLMIPAYITADARLVPARRLFPPSLDHLLPLIEYNVFRATITNVYLTKTYHLLSTNCTYTYGMMFPPVSNDSTNSPTPGLGTAGSLPLFTSSNEKDNHRLSIPPSLRPTTLQQNTPHPPWIDILPCAGMRDNAVRAAHMVDHQDLCADLLPSLSGVSRDPDAGLVAWSNPWEAAGWEVKPGFARKWGFLIRGCVELMEATNHYRALRGEKPIAWQ